MNMFENNYLSQFDHMLSERTETPRQSMLLVEDSEESEKMFKLLCRAVNKNIDVNCVQSGELALYILESGKQKYDYVVADHFLAGSLTGLDLWKECQENHKEIPFMMTSGMTADQFSELVESDSDLPDYLPKIVSYSKKGEILKDFLEHSHEEDPSPYLLHMAVIAGTLITLIMAPAVIAPLYRIQDQDSIRQKQLKEFEQPKDTPIEIRPEELKPQKLPLNIREIVTPQLKLQVQKIVKRDEQIKKLVGKIELPKKAN